MMAILAALWQADTAFPSGAFAFSNGIEGALALNGRLARSELAGILDAALRHRWATAERPAMVAAFRAAGDIEAAAVIDGLYDASTLPATLRSGSRRNGAAFLTSHARLGTAGAQAYRAAVAAGRAPGHLVVVQGLLWQACGLDERTAVAVSGFTTAAGLINAAVRLGCIGAVDGQGVLIGVLPTVAEFAARDVATGAPDGPTIASMTPWLDIAATRHERADVRLFAN